MNLINSAIKAADIVQIFIRAYCKVDRVTMCAGSKHIDLMKTVMACRIEMIWIHRVNPVAAIIEEEILACV